MIFIKIKKATLITVFSVTKPELLMIPNKKLFSISPKSVVLFSPGGAIKR